MSTAIDTCKCPKGWPREATRGLYNYNHHRMGSYVVLAHTGDCMRFDELLRTLTYAEPRWEWE